MYSNRSYLFKAVPAFVALICVLFAGSVYAQPRGYDNWHYGPGMMWGAGSGWFGGISMFLFWGLIIFAVILAARWLMRSTGDRGANPGPSASRPLDILKERYARGEITKEQYQSMRKDIET